MSETPKKHFTSSDTAPSFLTWMFWKQDVFHKFHQLLLGVGLGFFLYGSQMYGQHGQIQEDFSVSSSIVLVLIVSMMSLTYVIFNDPLRTANRHTEWIFMRGGSRRTIALRELAVVFIRAFLLAGVTVVLLSITSVYLPMSGFLKPLETFHAFFFTAPGLGIVWCTISVHLIMMPLFQVLRHAPFTPWFPGPDTVGWHQLKRPVILFRMFYRFLIPVLSVLLVFHLIDQFYTAYLVLSPVFIAVAAGVFVRYFSRLEPGRHSSREAEGNEHQTRTGVGRRRTAGPSARSGERHSGRAFSASFRPYQGLIWHGFKKRFLLLPILFFLPLFLLTGGVFIAFRDPMIDRVLFEFMGILTMIGTVIMLAFVDRMFKWDVSEDTGRYLYQSGFSAGTLVRARLVFVGSVFLLLLFLFQAVGFDPFGKPGVLFLFSLFAAVTLLQEAPFSDVRRAGRYGKWIMIVGYMVLSMVMVLFGYDVTAFLDRSRAIILKMYVYVVPLPFLIFLFFYYSSLNESALRESLINQEAES